MTIFLFFFFGTIIGSFLNVVILRLPGGELLTGRSHCPHCGHILSPAELVPLFSYLFLRGRCKSCRERISPRYFLIELFTGLLFAAAAYFYPPASLIAVALLAKTLVFISVLVVVFAIDFEHYLIFDSVLISGLVPVLVLSAVIDLLQRRPLWSLHGLLINSLLSAIAAAVPFFLLWFFSSGKWMGFGDVKLALLLGAALTWPWWGIGLMLGVFLGGISGVLLLVWGKKTLGSKVPFGTFLSLGALIALFYGQVILSWYLTLLGF